MIDTDSELAEYILLGEDSRLELMDVRFIGNSVSSPNNRSMADELAAMVKLRQGCIHIGI